MSPTQLPLPLPAPPATGDTPLVPVRMVNEWVYCPRLAYLMWVDGEWSDTGDTEDGRRVHARTDRPAGRLPPPPSVPPSVPAPDAEPEEEPPPFAVRALSLSSERLGLIARLDTIEGEGETGTLVPVDLKRGARPHVERGAFDPERVQLCAQGLILEDHGYRVTEGALWFAASRERVRVPFDAELRDTTLRAIAELRLAAAAGRRPPPLQNSPKCPRCALAAICLPDEVRFFDRDTVPRLLVPDEDAALPLHVATPGARIRKEGETLRVAIDDAETTVPLSDVSDLVLWGPVSLTTPTLHALMGRNVPVSWHSTGGWLLGHTTGTGTKAVSVRIAQFRAAADEALSRRIARGLVAAKLRNQRTMLRRNWKRDPEDPELARALDRLRHLADATAGAPDTQALLGLEGEGAALYFGLLPGLIAEGKSLAFDFARRNRRPPEDPVNAMLSFAYACLVRTLIAPLVSAGLDPWLGFFHRPRHGRPALALDMMEPFRPLLADSAVLMAINNGEVGPGDFVRNGPACALHTRGRKALIAAWERRLDQETTHPVFGYRLATRRLLALQCRLLSRFLEGEIPDMPHYVPR